MLSTGGYPGKARNLCELMADLEKVLILIPGKLKINLHATYGDFKWTESTIEYENEILKKR